MREILFRGKRESDGKWIYGLYSDNYVHETDFPCIMPLRSERNDYDWKVIPETVGQCTGLKDKNGKMIFEGDIVTMPAYGGGRTKSMVYFKNGKFAVNGSNYGFKDIAPRRMEVIGNIYDNPEL